MEPLWDFSPTRPLDQRYSQGVHAASHAEVGTEAAPWQIPKIARAEPGFVGKRRAYPGRHNKQSRCARGREYSL